jgi:hypothetical protein
VSERSGVACHIVVQNVEAHRKLHQFCLNMAREYGTNVIYVDWEQSLYSYDKERVALAAVDGMGEGE